MSGYPIYSDTQSSELVLFSLKGSDEFGRQIAGHLGIPLSEHEEREFEDGEHKIRPMINVRHKDVFIVHSLYSDGRHSCNDKLCRLLFFIGAVKDAGAARVTAIVPYLAYARQDQKSQSCDPVTLRYVAQLFEASGADAVVAMDVHNISAFQNAFRCRTEHLEARTLFVEYFSELVQHYDVVVVSPDAGGMKRMEKFRSMLEQAISKPVDSAFSEKYRNQDTVSGHRIVGDVRQKLTIILDDMINTGTTLARAAVACKQNGSEKVVAAATHGLFSGNAGNILAVPAIEEIFICDTIQALDRLQHETVKSKLTMLSSAPLFAKAILRMHEGGSVTELLNS